VGLTLRKQLLCASPESASADSGRANSQDPLGGTQTASGSGCDTGLVSLCSL